jgi:hypothetical protein
MLCATFVWIAACSLGASGATQVTLNTIAEASLVVPQDTREAFHVREDARCREAFPPGSHPYSAWRDCMERSFWLDASVGTLDATLRAAQASLDAGDSGSVRRALPCVARAAARASDAFREAGLEVPADVSRLLDVGAEVSGGCPE